MSSKIPNTIIKSFYILFFLIFSIISIEAFFFSRHPFHTFVFLLVTLLIMVLASYMITRYEEFVNKYELKIYIMFFVIIIVTQVIVGLQLKTTPMWDFGRVYYSAIDWMHTGSLGANTGYFCVVSHQAGILTLLRLAFGFASLFGISDFYVVGVVLNVICISGTFLLTVLICRQLFGRKTALFSLFASVAYLPLLMSSAVFYTDTLSMPFLLLSYYVYLKAKNQKGKNRIALFILAGIVCAIGSLLKLTVVIAGIAIIIEYIFISKNSWAKYLSLLSMIITFIMIFQGFNLWFKNTMLDKDTLERYRMPPTAWIMMGLEGNGSYNDNDLPFLLRFNTYNEKVDAANKEIGRRLNDLGINGYLGLLYKKSMAIWGDGTLNLIINNKPVNNSWLHSFVLESGLGYKWYNSIVQAYHLLLLVMMALSAFLSAIRCVNFYSVVPRLSVFGLYLFLLMWETDARYLTNFVPLIIISATMFVVACTEMQKPGPRKRKLEGKE